MCCESYMHVACIVKKIEVIFQIRGKVRGSEIASRQKSLNDFVGQLGSGRYVHYKVKRHPWLKRDRR